MGQNDDVSAEHFDWLVAGRSRNQKATLDLYKIVEAHDESLSKRIPEQIVAIDLLAIAFSLWRAVFLSDLTGDVADRLADARRFLRSLIAHNAVLYQTDYAAREWTFDYYLDNAFFRLSRLPFDVLPRGMALRSAETTKDAWLDAQTALEVAIANFAEKLADHF